MTEFRIYNTLTSRKEKFVPVDPPKVGMYVCGITPYGPSHLGHARCYIVFDVLKKFLDFLGYEVKYIQNITDIDDKIIKKSAESGKPPSEISRLCMESFMEDMEKLNVSKADEYPMVSHTIPQIIEFIEGLVENGMAYLSDGSVYFRTGKAEKYGRLSGRKLEDLKAGEGKGKKESPEDFSLWKKDEEYGWESPWGRGRPGWHIECSVMSHMTLGSVFDIHGGGLDLIFPHHENEIAQSYALTGCVPAKYWIHNGMVTLKGDKMAKSTGNFFLLSGLLSEYDPMVLRMYLLRTGYRQPVDFDTDRLSEEAKAYGKLADFKGELLARAESFSPSPADRSASEVKVLMDDLNTPAAIGEIFKKITPILSRFYAGTHTENDIREGYGALEIFEGVLGIKLPVPMKEEDREIQSLVDERQRLRKEKDFEAADHVREKLDRMGVEVKDTPTGPRWTKKIR